MCYGVARPEPTGREFAGSESVDGGVRGILGFRYQASAISLSCHGDALSTHDRVRYRCTVVFAFCA